MKLNSTETKSTVMTLINHKFNHKQSISVFHLESNGESALDEAAVVWVLHWSGLEKSELSVKATLSKIRFL